MAYGNFKGMEFDGPIREEEYYKTLIVDNGNNIKEKVLEYRITSRIIKIYLYIRYIYMWLCLL